MPRQVDLDGRRRQIARAVFGLIAERGMEGATLRDAAERAGVSMGAVQRCFPTKEQMVACVMEHMQQRITERVRARVPDTADPDAAMTTLEHTLAATLALDPASRAETRVWLAFTAQAAIDPAAAAAQREQYTGLAELITLLIGAAQTHGHARPDLDGRQEAEALITLADGLNIQLLLGRHTAESARAALHHRLGALRTG
ncbi:TetR/AcrR family transcriptional regulator [Actinomadura rifamycini]|uniref:TetR/AcrR family transcriptional regulator n=1 Tax=Actinomadura rifamycini TaxID=31962 RepID=UPI00047BCA15|nr:TetR/AcrR family transcriptional regulator [Actinomadura rifamycini]